MLAAAASSLLLPLCTIVYLVMMLFDYF